jgi:hypothetical protein
MLEEKPFLCNIRHKAVGKFLDIKARKDPIKIEISDYNEFEPLFRETDWLSTRCSEFSCWWEKQLFESICWLCSAQKQNLLFELIVKEWLTISFDMICQGDKYCVCNDANFISSDLIDPLREFVSKNCHKSTVINLEDWEKHRLTFAIEKNPIFKEYILLKISKKLQDAKANAHVYNSLFTYLTKKALTDELDLLLTNYFGIASDFSSQFPTTAINFLEDIFQVVNKNPYLYFPYFGDYIKPIAKNALNDAQKKKISFQIEGWIDKTENSMQKASIRRAQDKFKYLIWNHKPRPPRKSGDKEKTKVQICLPEPIGLKTFIEATLADVSDGPENRRGIGIRLRTSGWILKEGIDLKEPKMIIEFNDKRLEGTFTALRCFDYQKYGIDDYGVVFEIANPTDQKDLKNWQEFVFNELEPVDYGSTGILR